MGKIYYETSPMPQIDGTNIVVNGDGKLDLGTNITTKLSKVDTTDNLSVELAKKIDKPASATNGQVLTYNGTSNEWEAKNPSASITEPTELEKGIIGGDEWVSGGSYTIGESVVIDENKLYLLVGDGGSTTKPSTDATHSIWKEISISAINSNFEKLFEKIKIEDFFLSTPNVRSFESIIISKRLIVINILTDEIGSGWTEPYFAYVNSQYAPKTQFVFAGNDYSGGSKSSVSIDANGQIKIYNGSGKASTVGALIIYPIE